jgi:5-methylcytosine-specific restriction endonuclease McrA
MNKKSEIRKEVIYELRLRGLSFKEISKTLGVSRQRIHQIYKDYRITPTRERRVAIDLASNRCVVCGSKKNIEIHHLDEDTNNNEQCNLMVLCRNCHHRLGRKINK